MRALIASAILGAVVAHASADWPLFRGNPLQTGVAPAPLPAPLAVLWKLQAKDAFEATAAIAGGTVYAGAYDGTLYALDLATGKPKWTYKAGPIKAAPSKPRPVSLVRLPLPARSNSPALDKHASTRAPISTHLALPFGICSLVVCLLLGARLKKFTRDKKGSYPSIN